MEAKVNQGIEVVVCRPAEPTRRTLLVAAHVCVRTDEELQQTLNAALAHKMGWDCEFSITTKLKNLLRTGYALGDVSKTIWLELLRWHCKGM